MGQNLVQEIDQTLDLLIKNAEMISQVDLKDLSEFELAGFQKTQESLLHHLLHVDSLLEKTTKLEKKFHPKTAAVQIQEKKKRFDQLNQEFNQELLTVKNKPIICKRKAKKLISRSI